MIYQERVAFYTSSSTAVTVTPSRCVTYETMSGQVCHEVEQEMSHPESRQIHQLHVVYMRRPRSIREKHEDEHRGLRSGNLMNKPRIWDCLSSPEGGKLQHRVKMQSQRWRDTGCFVQTRCPPRTKRLRDFVSQSRRVPTSTTILGIGFFTARQ